MAAICNGVDATPFAVTDYGQIDAKWQWSDAAGAPADEDRFGFMLGICNGGAYLEMLEPEKGSVSYFDLSSAFGEGPPWLPLLLQATAPIVSMIAVTIS